MYCGNQILILIYFVSMKAQIVMMEMFTSISAMEEIVHSERMLIENLENYIGLERSRIDILEG
jgi:hypothetical protein